MLSASLQSIMHGWTISFTAEAIPLSSTGRRGEPCVFTDGSQTQDPPWLVVGTHSSLREGRREWGRWTWQRSLPSALPPHHLGPTHGPLPQGQHSHTCSQAVSSHRQTSPCPGQVGSVDSTRGQTLFTISFTEPGAPRAPPSLPTAPDHCRLLPPLQLEDVPLTHWVIAFAQNLAWVSPILKRSFPLPPAPGSVLLP